MNPMQASIHDCIINDCHPYFITTAIIIGFNSTDYRVDENAQGGVVAVNVRLLNGTLQKNVVISISTESSSAIRKPTM